ncbi:MAG: SUMF1/EgtB/PvdO family nonheme iron enzyme [Polyangiaceae bacterium]
MSRVRRKSDLAAIGVVGIALALLVWAFVRARSERPSLDARAAPLERDGIARIEAGPYAADPRDWDVPNAPHVVVVLDAFLIDAREVTEGAYEACVRRGACTGVELRGSPSLPVTRVSAREARAFCVDRGGALPSALQFARAAGGPNGARFPWGDIGPVCASAAWGRAEGPCAFGETVPDPVGSHPSGSTSEGIDDLAGNVAEWIEGGDGRVEIRGGSFRDSAPTPLKTWAARTASDDQRFDDVGFRCAYPAPPR